MSEYHQPIFIRWKERCDICGQPADDPIHQRHTGMINLGKLEMTPNYDPAQSDKASILPEDMQWIGCIKHGDEARIWIAPDFTVWELPRE